VRALGAEGKAPATIRKASQIAGAVLEDAVRRGLIGRSPHRGVRLPKLADEEMMFLTAEQTHAVSDSLGDFRGMGLLGGFGGLRLGEVLGLRVDDVGAMPYR
jgi:integrase